MKIKVGGLVVSAVIAAVSVVLFLGFASAGPQVTPLAPLGINSVDKMVPNGAYVVSVWKDGSWQTAGNLFCDRFFRERTLDLANLVVAGQPTRIRIAQKGGGAAHIDAALLGGVAPEKIQGAGEPKALTKLSKQDFDVIDSFHKVIELTYPTAGKDRTLGLTARVESLEISKTPFQFPTDNLFKPMNKASRFYSYRMNTEGTAAPFFKEYSQTGSGHPSGFTYGWVRNDEKNLYVKVDFTPDNTMDGDKDYAKVYVNTPKGLREFKVSVPEKKWGKADFAYTDKVSYEHKVYDFTIPLKQIGVSDPAKTRDIQLAFAAYGTATPAGAFQPYLSFNTTNNTYLAVYTTQTVSPTENAIKGQLLTSSGVAAGPEFTIIDLVNNGIYTLFPKAAYSSTQNRFLAVADDSSGGNLLGQLVSADTTSYGTGFFVTNTAAAESQSHLTYDSVNDRFLAIWNHNSTDVYGAFVTASTGSLVSTITGTKFVISDAIGIQDYPASAFDSTNKQHLVVWEDQRNPFYDIYGALVNASTGTLVSTASGTNFVISDAANSQLAPSVAYDSVNHRFLVVFTDLRNSGVDFDIYGQIVNADGTLYRTASGTNFVISNVAGNQMRPSVVYEAANNRFLVVWSDQRGATPDIYGQYVNIDGSLAGANFAIANQAVAENTPVAAYNSICGNTLVSFESISTASNVLGGQIWDIGLSLVGTCASGAAAGGGGGGGCFIATAAYGSDMAADVRLLREFRDNHLLTNTMGRAFVSMYYSYSPPVADFIAGSEPLKAVVRVGLAPVVFAVRYPFIVLAGILTLACVTVYRLRMRRSQHT